MNSFERPSFENPAENKDLETTQKDPRLYINETEKDDIFLNKPNKEEGKWDQRHSIINGAKRESLEISLERTGGDDETAKLHADWIKNAEDYLLRKRK